MSQIIAGLSLPIGLQLGKGVYICHCGTIIVSGQASIGEDCSLSPGIVIGHGVLKGKKGCPTIGDRVFIGPGAKLFGPITIGDDVAIGANAVVNCDIPDHAIAAGVPAKVVSYKGSADYVNI